MMIESDMGIIIMLATIIMATTAIFSFKLYEMKKEKGWLLIFSASILWIFYDTILIARHFIFTRYLQHNDSLDSLFLVILKFLETFMEIAVPVILLLAVYLFYKSRSIKF